MRSVNYLVFGLLILMLAGNVYAHQANVSYFYGDGCKHCAKVHVSGVLEEVANMDGVTVEQFEIYYNDENRQKYMDICNRFGIPQDDRGIPFVMIECENNSIYIMGESIIGKLPEVLKTCESDENFQSESSPLEPGSDRVVLGSLIVAALIDSVNPCAFGVLIFLMLSLLKMGSSKRALRAGLTYTLVVFIVYFLSGLGIFKVIQSFTAITHIVYIASGVLVLSFGLWQFKDVFLPKIGPTLQISPKIKPLIEKITQKGTIPAMILLGILVSLFELPCTGGIYLGILTMMSINKTFAIPYLLLYNLIFVLPLIILTFMIYKGMSPSALQKWTSSKRNWMKLGSGVILVALGVYILVF
jgi:cytochrome c biogenesis protein CcdA